MSTAGPSRPNATERLRQLVGIDARSLACLRIGLGAVILADLLSRVLDLPHHYSDWGVLPRVAVQDWLPLRTEFFPAYFLSGSTGWAAFLFLLTGASALALLLGWKTRVATIVCWYLVSSLQIRNPAVLHGGDNILRIFLLWSVFLPLGSAWSFDARGRGLPRRIVSVASLAIQVQLCLVYLFTAIYKSDPAWTTERTAVLQSLHLDHMTTSWGVFLRGYPGLLELATGATLMLEFLGPILLWIPFMIGPIRFGVVLTFVFFHLAFLAPTFDLGTFPWVAAVAWSVFLPTWFWDRVGKPTAAPKKEVAGAEVERPTAGSRNIPKLVGHVVTALLLTIAVLWNIRDQDPERFKGLLPHQLDPAIQILGLQQSWKMFAPRPPAEDGWFIVPAQLTDGTTVDIWTGEPVSLAKPADVNATFLNSRWVKYLMNMSDPEYLTHRPLMTQYLCRRWNRNPDRARVSQLEVLFILETFDPATGVSSPQPQSLGGQLCRDPTAP